MPRCPSRPTTSTLSSAVTGALNDVRSSLNGFVEALAVMIVTSCIIPLLVLVFFLWLVRVLFGVVTDVPLRALAPRSLRGSHLH